MKNIIIKIQTNSLGHMQITPVPNDSEAMQILRAAKGSYNEDVIEAINDTSNVCSLDTYLIDCQSPNCITVIDENGETEYENTVEDLTIDTSLISELIRNGVDLDNPSDEAKEEFLYDYDCELLEYAKIIRADVVGEDGQVPSLLFEKIKSNDESIAENGLIISHVRSLAAQYGFHTEENIDDQKCLLNFGDIGKGVVSFYIDLEDDEEFDINKLHFFCESSWWDCHVCELSDELTEIFESNDVLLDFVEYDGKIYCNSNVSFAPGYKNPGEIVLMTPDMHATEL
jgi:hypothetical protein